MSEAEEMAAKLTKAQRRAFLAFDKQRLMPREFARRMWPDSDGWRRPTNCGHGVSIGGGMRLAAGGMLGKLRRQFPECFYWTGTETGLTPLGLAVRQHLQSSHPEKTHEP